MTKPQRSMRRRGLAALCAVLVLPLVMAVGCTRVRLDDVDEPGDVTTKNVSVGLAGATAIDARITMPVGRLVVDGGSSDAMDATFRYAPKSWEPQVDYRVDGGVGRLEVDQPSMESGTDLFGQKANDWDIRLARAVPFDLEVEMGAGESQVDLTDVQLNSLQVRAGVGESEIDISGNRTSDLSVDVEAGVGALTLRVPSDVGVRIEASEGIGSFEAEGFTADGEALVNDAWDTSDTQIEIALRRGVGDITVEQVR